jgi:HEPN superfamily RiboL-PSP-like protein
VVFAIGALDAFIHDLVLEIVPHFPIASDELDSALRELAKSDPSLALKVALSRPGEADAVFAQALGDYLDTQTFQSVNAINRAVRYIGRDLNWDKLPVGTAGQLQNYIQLRNGVVHRRAATEVTDSEAANCISVVRQVARAINDLAVTHYHRGK